MTNSGWLFWGLSLSLLVPEPHVSSISFSVELPSTRASFSVCRLHKWKGSLTVRWWSGINPSGSRCYQQVSYCYQLSWHKISLWSITESTIQGFAVVNVPPNGFTRMGLMDITPSGYSLVMKTVFWRSAKLLLYQCRMKYSVHISWKQRAR